MLNMDEITKLAEGTELTNRQHQRETRDSLNRILIEVERLKVAIVKISIQLESVRDRETFYVEVDE